MMVHAGYSLNVLLSKNLIYGGQDGYIFCSGLTALEIFGSLVAVKMLSNTSLGQRLKKQLTMKHGLYLTYHFKEAS